MVRNKTKHNEYCQKYRQNNRELILLGQAKYRAKKKGIKFDLELSALYGVNPEGEEIVIDIGETSLYILYNPTDDGRYEFYAEIGDEERMEELLSDEEIDEEEE